MTATLESPAAAENLFQDSPATITPAPLPAASQIESLKAAVNHALSLEGFKSAAGETSATVAELREKIENSTDEREVVKLMKQLSESETSAKIQSIRAKKLDADLAAAWQAAGAFVLYAINEAQDAVGDACHGSYDAFREIAVKCLAPEVVELANDAPAVAFRINSGLDSVASGALAVGPANQLQQSLLTARTRDHYKTPRQYCEDALAAIREALEGIPAIKEQAAKLAAIHAAVFELTR
jgi:hypothetical protein